MFSIPLFNFNPFKEASHPEHVLKFYSNSQLPLLPITPSPKERGKLRCAQRKSDRRVLPILASSSFSTARERETHANNFPRIYSDFMRGTSSLPLYLYMYIRAHTLYRLYDERRVNSACTRSGRHWQIEKRDRLLFSGIWGREGERGKCGKRFMLCDRTTGYGEVREVINGPKFSLRFEGKKSEVRCL